MTWTVVANSWQYTSIYGADGKRLFLMDLEDWGVTEENLEVLEKQQADIAALAAQAPDMLEALLSIAEGNLGGDPWQANQLNYDKIRKIAADAAAKAQGHISYVPSSVMTPGLPLEDLIHPLDGFDKNQPGYQHRKGWNDAIMHCMDLQRALSPRNPPDGESAVRAALLKHLPPLSDDDEYNRVFQALLAALPASLMSEAIIDAVGEVERYSPKTIPMGPNPPLFDGMQPDNDGPWVSRVAVAKRLRAVIAGGTL